MNHSSTQSAQTSANLRNKSKILPDISKDEAFLPHSKSATQEVIERMEYEMPETVSSVNGRGEAINAQGDSVNTEEKNFKSELEFDGYGDIAEYDNDAYQANVDGRTDDRKELNFSDREELDNGDENLVDHQENRRTEDQT